MELNQLLKTTRQYFWRQNFEEIEVNYLNKDLPLEPNLYAFETIWRNQQQKFYLPTSPEFALKQHLATQKTNCFAISHCFRDLENSGPQHHPEFLMLEYYLVNKNLAELQKSLAKYIRQFLDLKIINYKLPANLPTNEPDFNQYFLNVIEPKLPSSGAVFVTGYPAFLSPLAKSETHEVDIFFRALNAPHSPRDKKMSTSKRFELYINGIEIANGCEENTDVESIKSAFEAEKNYRLQNNLPLHPYSTDFIENCSILLPCSGVGIGLERLLMIINQKNNI